MSYFLERRLRNIHDKRITALTINIKGAELFTGSEDSDIHCWDMNTPCGPKLQSYFKKRTIRGHAGVVTGLMWITHLNVLISSGNDGQLIVWNGNGAALQVIWLPNPIPGIIYNRYRLKVVAGSRGVVYVYDTHPSHIPREWLVMDAHRNREMLEKEFARKEVRATSLKNVNEEDLEDEDSMVESLLVAQIKLEKFRFPVLTNPKKIVYGLDYFQCFAVGLTGRTYAAGYDKQVRIDSTIHSSFYLIHDGLHKTNHTTNHTTMQPYNHTYFLPSFLLEGHLLGRSRGRLPRVCAGEDHA